MALNDDVRRERGTPVTSAGWAGARAAVPVVVLLAALFLAHGLQCAVPTVHEPGEVLTHDVGVLASGGGAVQHGVAGDAVGLAAGLLPLVVHQVNPPGNSSSPGHAAGVVCVAVLIAAGTFFLLAGRYLSYGGHGAGRVATGFFSQPKALARWRPPSPDMAVLCVLRT